jgi:hypothetical protein
MLTASSSAAARTTESAHINASEPASLQLRYLQPLTEIASDRPIRGFPLPMDILQGFLKLVGDQRTRRSRVK